MSRPRVLFLGSAKTDHETAAALAFCQRHADVTAEFGDWTATPPIETWRTWSGDYIVSFRSRWIVPPEVLAKARIAALNFHPGPPEYRGFAVASFALYDGVTTFGVTAHQMTADVDAGPILDVRRFPVLPADDLTSVLARTYTTLLAQLYDVMGGAFLLGAPGPPHPKAWMWAETTHTRAEYFALQAITPDLSPDEIARRVRATTYGPYAPAVHLGGYTFRLERPLP